MPVAIRSEKHRSCCFMLKALCLIVELKPNPGCIFNAGFASLQFSSKHIRCPGFSRGESAECRLFSLLGYAADRLVAARGHANHCQVQSKSARLTAVSFSIQSHLASSEMTPFQPGGGVR